jgi:hypothetical protein
MLSEFALLPSVFDDTSHPDREAWREHLRELGRGLFPREAPEPAVVADMYGGAWTTAVLDCIRQISDHRAKKLCEDLLTQIKRISVCRPPYANWPGDDIGWAKEALTGHRQEPFDRVVGAAATRDALADDFPELRSLEEVEGSGFWRGVRATTTPPGDLKSQVKLLRKIWLHAQWVAVINPYGATTELGFATELFRRATERPEGFPALECELHVQVPKDRQTSSLASSVENVANNVMGRLAAVLAVGQEASVYFWPPFRERRILAGTFAELADGSLRKRPRWSIAMTHVAREGEGEAGGGGASWSLTQRDDLIRYFDQFVAENAANRPSAWIARGIQR